MHATAEVAAGNVTFTVQLAPGTLDRQATRVVILLDTDQSASTGIRQTDGMGVDYALELLSSEASISRANLVGCAAMQGCYDVLTTTPINSIPDGMQVTVSLATLGNSDGRIAFKLHTYVTITVGQTLTPLIFDSMPDAPLPPGRIQQATSGSSSAWQGIRRLRGSRYPTIRWDAEPNPTDRLGVGHFDGTGRDDLFSPPVRPGTTHLEGRPSGALSEPVEHQARFPALCRLRWGWPD